MCGQSLVQAQVAKEYEIKAGFLYNFTKFVEWPAERLPAANTPLIIGILGQNPFGNELAQVVADRKVNQHPIILAQLHSAAEIASVHVVFVPATSEYLLGNLRTWPVGVLAVGETERFAKFGAVTFTTAGDKVRFAIDISIAERGGLKISAQLQKLASTVAGRK
jgi:hypothetical protein